MKRSQGNYRPIMIVKVSMLVGLFIVLGFSSPGFAQELSQSALETLLSGDVAQRRIAELVKERGIDFELTDDVRARLSKIGAGPTVMDSLNLAAIRRRLKLEAEKAKSEALAKEQRKTGETVTPPTKADQMTEMQAGKSDEAQKKPEATTKAEQKASAAGKTDISQEKVVTLPDQLKETADQVLTLENIAIRDGDVSGELVNRSTQGVYGVDLQVLYSWRWNNDFHPGRDDPGRAEYFKIEKEISPGQRVPFVHKPSPPLPARKDGTFDISIKVIGFTRVFREKAVAR
jgi:hypothetical protein